MKKQNRKLNLNRETLISLQDNELDGVNGAAGSPLTSKVVSQVESVTTKWTELTTQLTTTVGTRGCK